MDYKRVKPLTLTQLAKAVRAPLNTTLRCIYVLAAQERWVDRWAIINPGCTVQEIDSAEQRVGMRFHQLHRLLLTLSNGGSIPFVTSVSLFAAAIARETEWRVVGPFLTAAERGAGLFITAHQVQAIYLSPPEDPALQGWGCMALWLAVWEIVCSTAGPAGMYACGARTIPKSSLLVSAGHSVSPSGEQVWSAVSSPGIPLAVAVGSGQCVQGVAVSV